MNWLKKVILTIQDFVRKPAVKSVFSFISRNAIKILPGLIFLYYLNPSYMLLHNLALIVVLESIALVMTGIAIYTTTHINFVEELIDVIKNKITSFEALAHAIIISGIFIGVHFLVGVSWFILQYNDKI